MKIFYEENGVFKIWRKMFTMLCGTWDRYKFFGIIHIWYFSEICLTVLTVTEVEYELHRKPDIVK